MKITCKHTLNCTIIKSFKIRRSLSSKGNLYDNAVNEATNKILKTEFLYQKKIETLEQLQLELSEYIY
ncbi:IS3 family transposase [Tissierella pigra]|uniref:IS3 family transposase n=1 Tax=Tissierella pigra TaxID=2607614 RepID=A0A6N7XLT4_9FIRM|nr:IS3 family transposase [Tissierella pigra]MSU03051.1 IS3 family transposase [Tissierella pigra]